MLAGTALVVVGGLALRTGWHPQRALGWTLLAGGTLAYVLGLLRRLLPRNRTAPGAPVRPRLGAGNTLTVARGVATALLAGFLVGPRAPGWLAWAPALVYLGVGVLDFADGYVARVTGSATLLGQRLDVAYDALATLVAVSLAVAYGQLPPPYLALGAAYYLFHGHMALRRRRGQAVHSLPPSGHRRFFSGCLYGYLAVVLAPAFAPPATILAGTLFGLPVAVGFVRDWLVATGRIDPASDRYRRRRRRLRALLFDTLPVGIRATTLAAGSLLLARGLNGAAAWAALPGASMPPVTVVLAATAVPALGSVALGAMARVGALLLLATACADLLLRGFGLLVGATLTGSIAVLLLGPGAYTLWRPEEPFLLKRMGTSPPPRSTEHPC